MVDTSYAPFAHVIAELEVISDPLAAFGAQIVSGPAIARTIENLNRQQLDAGMRADGSDISPDYTPLTVFLKSEKGQPTDRVTLRDTGEFYADIRAEFDNDEVVLRDDNEKTIKLQNKYGDEILGLSDQSIKRITDLLLPIFEGHARQELLPKLLYR